MSESPRTAMSEAERGVLKVLWEEGPLAVRDVLARLTQRGQEWTRSTVITLLQRLEKKGYVESDKSQPAFVFRAAVSREQEMHSRIEKLAGELCDGDAVPLMLAFAERHRFSPGELDRFRTMIDALEATPGKRGQP